MNFGGPPDPDMLEVSLFGTGVGESIAVHIGQGNWLLVDSCRQGKDDLPAHISYLQSIGVDLSKAVKLFVITHWHDDHIDGAAEVVKQCSEAKIAISSALSAQEFLKTLSIYNRNDYWLDRDKSGIREFGMVLENIKKRNRHGQNGFSLVRTHSDQILYRSDDCSICAISPSDKSIDRTIGEFSEIWEQISRGEQRLSFPSPHQNHDSIALWIRYKDQRILLGSDLEVTNDSDTGWAAVLKINQFPDGKSQVFKIPHHGSPNGDCAEVWETLVSPENPFLAVTSYSRGRTQRPSDEDLWRLMERTTNLYSTSLPKRSMIRRESAVERTIKEVSKNRWTVGKNLGQIRIREKGIRGEISVEVFGSAEKVIKRTPSH